MALPIALAGNGCRGVGIDAISLCRSFRVIDSILQRLDRITGRIVRSDAAIDCAIAIALSDISLGGDGVHGNSQLGSLLRRVLLKERQQSLNHHVLSGSSGSRGI